MQINNKRDDSCFAIRISCVHSFEMQKHFRSNQVLNQMTIYIYIYIFLKLQRASLYRRLDVELCDVFPSIQRRIFVELCDVVPSIQRRLFVDIATSDRRRYWVCLFHFRKGHRNCDVFSSLQRRPSHGNIHTAKQNIVALATQLTGCRYCDEIVSTGKKDIDVAISTLLRGNCHVLAVAKLITCTSEERA